MQICRKLKNNILAAVAGLALVACTAETSQQGFSLDGYHDGQQDGYAYLYVLLPEYQRTMPIDSVKVRSGKFHFSGVAEEPMEAFVKFSGDSLVYDFILTNNRLEMNVQSGGYSVQGSPSNRQLSKLLAYRESFNKRRADLQSEYKKAIADSSLTRLAEDSLMVAYRQAGVDYRKKLLTTMSFSAKRYPLIGQMSLRIFGKDLLQSQVDSIKSLIVKQK